VQVPRTTKTTYVAFGDSITEGFLRDRPETFLVDGLTYPGQLQMMLTLKYPAQAFSMINEGVGGETAAEGRRRLPGVLDAEKPEVLLLLEGYNEIRFLAPSSIENDLRLMVGEAQRRGILVLLATLTPVTPGKEKDSPGHASAIRAVNTKIRALAPRLKVPLVDLFAALDGRWSMFGSDGVHPNPSGYQLMAEAFFAEIVRGFDAPVALRPSDLTLFASPVSPAGSTTRSADGPAF
jgi:lysophospholipase L1-like esterase